MEDVGPRRLAPKEVWPWRTPVLTPGRKYLVSSSRRTLAQTAESDFQLNHVLKEVETGGRPELEGGRWLRRAKDLTPPTEEREEARTLRPRRIITHLGSSSFASSPLHYDIISRADFPLT
jgi:hypothetical protein